MNIVGKGKKVLDADLLSRLAVNAQSGSTVSKAELQSAIKDVSADLKDQFSYADSTRGLTRMKDAVANTLELAAVLPEAAHAHGHHLERLGLARPRLVAQGERRQGRLVTRPVVAEQLGVEAEVVVDPEATAAREQIGAIHPL